VEGSYRISLPGKKSYRVDVRATGFLSDMKQIDIPESYTPDIYNLDVTLVKVKVGRKVVLNNILFETGKSVLTAGSYDELNRLLNYMLDYPLMKIEVSGHTDITGSAAINLSLSEARAKAVVMYLTNKGIDNSRMKYHGYGSIQPISDNTTSQGRARNRRVEFKILEF
jgi:outer membrane protein OmpA-like peptidoglycan-associated protein